MRLIRYIAKLAMIFLNQQLYLVITYVHISSKTIIGL